MKKTVNSLMLIAVAAMAFTACNREAKTLVTENAPEMKALRFSAFVQDDETKATFTTKDDKSFYANWEIGDRIWVTATKEGEDVPDYDFNSDADWNGSAFVTPKEYAYGGDIPGVYHYRGLYPGGGNHEFQQYRNQVGNEYNSLYDLMIGHVTYENVLFGENPDGGDIVIPMDRLTSIVYFHLTSDLDEPLTSATLTVEGGDIASDEVDFYDGAIETRGRTYNSIVITFPKGKAPSARDFQLWYNIIPVEATSLTLTVTTDSKITTIRNTKGKSFVAGKLNKIVKDGLNWTDDPNAIEPLTVAQFVEKEVGDDWYKLTGKVERADLDKGSFYLNDGTGSIYVDSVRDPEYTGYSRFYFEDGDEITLIGKRGETTDGNATVWYAYHFSHVYVPHLYVTSPIIFGSNDYVKEVEFVIRKFDCVVDVTVESSKGTDSRFWLYGWTLIPKERNEELEDYTELFTVTASDGKHKLQKDLEVCLKGQGVSNEMDVTFNGYNEEKDF
ncbi:MAG: hypothetical protein IKV62_04130 [Bacteroidales bacterium]|nr:hypothetical protein [Bacteroidales bacterium]